MTILQVYRRALSLLAAERALTMWVALSGVAVAAVQLAEPVLFGRVVDAMAGEDSGETRDELELRAGLAASPTQQLSPLASLSIAPAYLEPLMSAATWPTLVLYNAVSHTQGVDSVPNVNANLSRSEVCPY